MWTLKRYSLEMPRALGIEPGRARWNLSGPALALVLLSACSSTSFVSTWKTPGATPVDFRGSKVVAAVMVKSESARRVAEDRLAHEISSRGALGIALYRLVPEAETDEAVVRGVLEREGVKGLVSLRPIDVHQQLVAEPVPADPLYGGFWNGYYAYGWNHPWDGTAVSTRVETVVSIETLVYSLQQNMLLWGGQSKTTNPNDVDELVAEVARAAAKELENEGLIARR
jgi:hypothetical protein